MKQKAHKIFQTKTTTPSEKPKEPKKNMILPTNSNTSTMEKLSNFKKMCYDNHINKRIVSTKKQTGKYIKKPTIHISIHPKEIYTNIQPTQN